MLTVNPYLTFNGNCEEAFEFYSAALSRPLASLSRFGDMPQDSGRPLSEEDKKKVLHATLPISDEIILMGSDTVGNDSPQMGTNISLSINVDARPDADRIFKALSEGGTVTMPLQDTFWGAYFGMWTDKFGIHWMINYDDPSSVMPH